MSWAATPGATWGFVAGTAALRTDPLGDGVRRMLGEVQRDVRSVGLEFTHTVRTWYYIGDILGAANHGSRYERFNAARNEFYRDKWPDLCRTPASTA